MTENFAVSAVSPAQAVEHAMALLRTNPTLAEQQAEQILLVLPDDARAIFVVAAARRRLGDAATARRLLERLTAKHPHSAYAHHELGLTLAGLGEGAAALAALRRAANLRRDVPSAWLALSDQLTLAGDAGNAAAAYAEHVGTIAGDADVLAATAAIRHGRLRDAVFLLRRHLTARPADAAALRMLAEAVFWLGHKDDAEELLARCVALDPGFAGARFSYASVLFMQNKPRAALAQLGLLAKSAPHDAKMLMMTTNCLIQVGDFEAAATVAAALADSNPEQPTCLMCRGQVARISGNTEAAAVDFRRAIALRPGLGEAYWFLADMKVVRFTPAELATMREQAANDALSAEDRVNLHYALGKALEDAAAWGESFGHYAAGARLRRAAVPYDPDRNSAAVHATIAQWTGNFFGQRTEGGNLQEGPIFIVGLPRAGSTLLEQILASHSQVEATLELPEMAHLAGELGRPGRKGSGADYYAAVAGLSPAARETVGRAYLARVAPYRKRGRAYFIDKLPANYQHVGLIRLILPRARIIDVRRHPMAACFANFKQHFARGQDFSYDLAEAGRYYCDYVQLMDHFDTVLPGFVYRVIYEDLVADTEAEIRKLLAFCGLDFEPACLRWWDGERAIATHSSEQVRGPIFASAVDRWRHYAPWLDKLAAAVAPVMESWRADRQRALR